MIIHQLEKKTENHFVRIEAAVELAKPVPGVPERVFLQYPSDFADQLTTSQNAFMPAMALLASHLGEDLVVEGKVSRRLLFGLRDYLDVFVDWFPESYQPIQIEVDQTEDTVSRSSACAMAFSGGVDSYYTLLKHLPEKNATLPVTMAIFAHGLDIPLSAADCYHQAFQVYDAILAPLGIGLIKVETNLREFHRRLAWGCSYGTAIAGIAFSLDHLYRHFLFSAQHHRDKLIKQGSDIRLFSLLSTDAVEIIVDGQVNRMEKVEAISQFPPTYHSLRVCWEKLDGVRNCGRCEKCVRTMVELALTDRLDRYAVFNADLDYREVGLILIDSPVKRSYWSPILDQSIETGNRRLTAAIHLAFLRSFIWRIFQIPRVQRVIRRTFKFLWRKQS